MLERFTQRAREVLVTVAQQHARRIPASPEGGKPEVTVVHVLLALAEERDGLAAEILHAHGITAAAVRERVLADRKSALDGEALATLGIDLGAVREAIEASFGPGALDSGVAGGRWMRFGAKAKQVLALAVRATDPHRNRIGTEHVLLGVLRVGDPLTDQILTELHANPKQLADELVALIGRAAA